MNKKYWFVGTIGVFLAAIGVAWVTAAVPTIGTALSSPSYVVINTPTPVLFTVAIPDASLIPTSVNLLRINNAGGTQSIVAAMRDDGRDGDAVAGDRIFSARITLNEPTVGEVRFQASAAFKGVLKRVLSAPIIVTFDPFILPPDPGEAGKQTLKGVDSDSDGVRDDIQRYIALTYPDSVDSRQALSKYATALAPLEPGDSEVARIRSQVESVRCIAHVFADREWASISATLRSRMLDTAARLRAYTELRQNAPESTLEPAKTSELYRSCNF